MMTHEFDTEIGEYVDGTLPRERMAAFEAHLAACQRCQALVTDFSALRTTASSLERRNPPAHVWNRLAARLPATADQHGWTTRLSSASLPPAVAAGIILALVMTGAWLSWRDVWSSQSAAPAGVQATTGTDYVRDAATVVRQEISEIEGHLGGVDAGVMPAPTRAMFEEQLAITDELVVRATAVQQEEPSNELAQQSLFEALRSKLGLLQEMLALVNEMRKGNQEGTARIVSEMEP
jgi:anti-sigma factor ChrR (cupin superfamily)